jgi:hypothetical protein
VVQVYSVPCIDTNFRHVAAPGGSELNVYSASNIRIINQLSFCIIELK